MARKRSRKKGASSSEATEQGQRDEEATSEAPEDAAGALALERDAWTERLPKAAHWVLTVVTLGWWALIWRAPARLWIPAMVSAMMFFLSFAGWDMWPLGFVAVVPMLYVIDRCKTAKQAWMLSWMIGWLANFGGFYWVSGLLMDFAGMPTPVALFVCLLLCLAQGLAFAMFGALMHTVRSRTGWATVWLAPVLWVPVEFVMPYLFPFYIGNSQYLFLPMVQVAELLGPLAVTAALYVANGALYDLLCAHWLEKGSRPEAARRRVTIGAAVGFALVVANIVYGVVRIGQVEATQEAAETLRIGMVEGDIGIFLKEAPDKVANNLIIHQKLSKKLADEEKVDLIVWPESSYQSPLVFASTQESDDLGELERTTTRYPRRFPQEATWLRPSQAPLVDSDQIDRERGTSPEDRFAVQRGFKVPLLFGGVTFKALSEQELRDDPPNKKMQMVVDGEIKRVPRPYRIYNSAVLLDAEGRVEGMYNKTYLLAFGEYIPGAKWFPWIYDMIPAASDFTPGTEVVTFPFKGFNLGVMICYEDIIPAFGRKLAKAGPNVIINVTNDAWFGKTNEPYLHLALATFRTVETRKWLLRSTNTGVTAFIDATGRIVSQTSIYEPEVLAEDVAMMSAEPTPYVIIGDVLGYLGLAAAAGLVWAARRRDGDEADATS